VASSILYRNEDDVPFWGGNARKIFYRDKTNFFYAPQVKFYLTDCKNQPPIPGIRLTPIKLVSDYLKQVHEHGLFKMQEYLQELTLKMSNLDYNVPEITNDQICYVFSCPDDQKNTDYQVKIKNALKMAGIITPNDPKDKLRFITESEATAFFCTTLSSEMKVSPDPYLVCNVGDTLGLCTVEVSELPETAKVTLLDGQARISCGSLELDRNMREYLKDNVTSSPKDSEILKRFHDRLFEFYIENIKVTVILNFDVE
jgi:hypothetical protein